MTVNTMHIMDRSGDSRIMWDPERPAEVEAARAQFDKLTKPKSKGGQGYTAYKVNPEDASKGEVIREFDPAAGKLILAPAMAGG